MVIIAVMFTFSFSSAFATVPGASDQGDYIITQNDVEKNIADAYKLAQDDLLKTLTDAVDAVGFQAGKTTMDTVDGVEIAKADVEKVYKSEVYDKAVLKLEGERTKVLNAVAGAIASATDFNGKFVKSDYASGDEDAWRALGYAIYDIAWGTSVKYFGSGTGSVASDTELDNYQQIFENANPSTGTNAADVGKAAFERVRDAAKAAIQGTDLTAYSNEYNGNSDSNYSKAAALVTTALASITNIDTGIAANATWTDFKGAIGAVDAIYTAPINQGKAGGTFSQALAAIEKIADEPTAAAKLSYAQNKVVAELTKDINAWKDSVVTTYTNLLLEESLKDKKSQTAIDNANKMIADTKEQADAAIEVLTYLVKDCESVDLLLDKDGKTLTLRNVTTTNWNFTAANYALASDATLTVYVGTAPKSYKVVDTTATVGVMDIVNHIADLKAAAELKKATIQIDGTTLVEIESALEDAIDAAYKGTLNELNVGDAVRALYNRQLALNGKAAVEINNRSYDGVEKWDDKLAAEYDEDYYDAVRTVMTETKDAVNAATTIADADAAFLAGLEKLDAVPTIADKNAAQGTKEFRDLQKQYGDDLEVYIDYKDGLIKKGTVTYSWDKGKMLTNLKDELAKAYTVDALKTAYAEAKAEIDNLKNKAEMQKAAADLTARINALPTTATTADKATVEALRADVDAHNDYCDLIGNTDNKIILMNKLTNAEDAIQKAEIKAMKDAYDAIMKDGKVTTDEKAAVEALRADYDAFVKEYSGENATDVKIGVVKAKLDEVKVADAEDDLSDALVKEVSGMIVKLPADGSDPAAVKAARAAYDALTSAEKYGVGGITPAVYDKLVDAEKMVNALTGVETLKLTAGSSAKKGSITVKWTVKGTGDRDGFQIWKSTKKNKGFKKAFTTTKTTYKNTKGLKAGTRYYYKVRAYQVVDGKNVYSDWSNKAIRIAK